MEILYMIALCIIVIVGLVLFAMVIAGFVRGIHESRKHPEEPSYGESLLFPNTEDADEIFYDVWGTKQGYTRKRRW